MSDIIYGLIGSGIGLLVLGILFLRWVVVPRLKAAGERKAQFTTTGLRQIEKEFKIKIWSWIAAILVVIAIALAMMANS